jgi:hypothetical protein
MSTPGVWSEADLDHILGRFGTFIVERTGTDIDEAIANLEQYRDNIYVCVPPVNFGSLRVKEPRSLDKSS